MPLDIPNIDNRRYQELLNETLARIPVHTPEWTNYGPSDPGRTLVELFCFLTENLLYRANQVPERNRRKFLQLLGVPLQAGAAASGIVSFFNKGGPLQTFSLNADLEVRAGQVPFQTEHALDVLPVEGRVFYKRRLAEPAPRLEEYYRLLYASYKGTAPESGFKVDLYEAVPLELREPHGIDLGEDAVDASLWVALLAPPNPTSDQVRQVREAIQGKTMSLGIVPGVQNVSRRLSPADGANPEAEPLLRFELPALPPGGRLPVEPELRKPGYKSFEPRPLGDVLSRPGVVEITLPAKEELELWKDLDPLEAGVGDFPPALEDTSLNRRIITWLRVRAAGGTHIRVLWAGINAVTVSQRARIANEMLAPGTGLPEQVRTLSHRPVVPDSVRLTVNGRAGEWQEIDDLLAAGSEVEVANHTQPPGQSPSPQRSANSFMVNAEAGEMRFGDGLRGGRLPEGATLLVTYDYSLCAAGNVEKDAISSGPALPAGIVVRNPVRTWGGADPETQAQGERQIARHLQHRDRLVAAEDFDSIARRAPGVKIGRLEVLPAFHPDLSPNEPGDAPGTVTLLVIPRNDPEQPDAPRADRLFLDALCRYLNPRRLVTTELQLRGPEYVQIYVSVGIDVKAGHAVSEVREAVKRRLLAFLAPVYPDDPSTAAPPGKVREQGWPLRKAVLDRELMAEASRVEGVLLVNDALIAKGEGEAVETVPLTGIQLPRVLGISVQVGTPLPLDALRGQPTDALREVPDTTRVVPVPFLPEEC